VNGLGTLGRFRSHRIAATQTRAYYRQPNDAGEDSLPTYWALPEYSKSEVNSAGRILVEAGAGVDAPADSLNVINNWRACHSFPLNTFQVTLRDRARRTYTHALVAQRLKRVPSIRKKLIDRPTMRLTQMQDIGGCRAVVETVAQVSRLRKMYIGSEHRHLLHHEKDYIDDPKASGYRGVHLVYEYVSDRNTTYNGLLIEVQLRSLHQHAWATAVETAGLFLKEPLKSSEGPEEWLKFFSLAACVFARREDTTRVPNTPRTWRELRSETRKLLTTLEVRNKLRAYSQALEVLESPPAEHDRDYFLLILDVEDGERVLRVHGYDRGMLPIATAQYLAEERRMEGIPGAQVVLVSADSLAALRRAYPNFYLDTARFLEYLDVALKA
jgi:hypothetical protein